MTIYVALPAYNEEKAIEPLFASISQVSKGLKDSLKIILVNDGSCDDTSEAAVFESKKFDLCLLLVEHPCNLGLGRAFETAIKTFLQTANDTDCLVVMDCDNTQPPELIGNIEYLICKESYDIVIASRYRNKSKVIGLSAFRKLMSYGASFLFVFLTPIPGVRDYTCGYRGYKYQFLKKLLSCYGDTLFTQQGFACMVDLLLKSRNLSPRILEIPMILRYDNKTSSSKMKILKTIYSTMKLLLGNLFVVHKKDGDDFANRNSMPIEKLRKY
jgi:dolichol-phosphate mannosyltransferase